ncbi:MAG: hypothetical protein ABIR92_06270 [Gemmatimonadaceae bacterium]
MSTLISLGAGSRRPILIAALLLGGAAPAFAQGKSAPDTTKKTAPPAKTVSAPAKVVAQPTKPVLPPAGQGKTAPPPAGQTRAVPPTAGQTKAGTPAAGQTKAVTPAAGQTKGAAASPQQTGAGPRAGRGAPGLNVVTSDTASAAPLIMMREVFEYDRDGRRDPFLSLLATTDLRPTLSDLTLLMTVVDEPGRSVALVANNFDKKQKTVRVGDRLGRMRVSSIRADGVVFTIEEFGSNRRDSLLLRDSTKVRGR